MGSQIVNLDSVRSACQKCGIYKLCLPIGLSIEDQDQLDKIIKQRRPLERGEHLYMSGDDFDSVFALRSGSLKTYIVNEAGEEHVIGLKMPGDLIGFSGINGGHYANSAKALETCSICEIPFDRLEELGQKVAGLQHHVMEIMSKEIQQEQEKVAMCSKMSADARLASILLTLSDRFLERGYSASEFYLSMSRSDIANMLGLAVETISRLFTQFQEQGILQVDRKHIKLLDRDKLAALIKLD